MIGENYSERIYPICDHQGSSLQNSTNIYEAFWIKELKSHLIKNIPVAAGLAGGSADAAATLCLLNEIFQIGLSESELMELGVTLGADVPYCIQMGTALSEGIGEILTPLKPIPDCFIFLVKPIISVSTKYVYSNLS